MSCHPPAKSRPRRAGDSLCVAIAGNPNSGKTTIFNNLTGTHQHVANYPGVTVEKKEGTCHHAGLTLQVVDLPGTYSLTAYSIEEVVARDFLIEEKPDVVVDVLDASNLERNLYLATQLIELGAPLLLVLNMSDVAERRGFAIHTKRLGELLGARLVRTVGHKNHGTKELLDGIVDVAEGRGVPAPVTVTYGPEIEEELAKLVALIEAERELVSRRGPRWLAVKLLEDDTVVRERVSEWAADAPKLFAAAEASRRHIQRVFGDSAEIVIADRRYGFISGACQEAVVHTVEARHSMSDRIDAVVTHRVLGIPLFLLLTYLMFQFTFSVGAAPTGWLEQLFAWLGETVGGLWPRASESPIRSLLVDGMIAGVGGVLTFVPYIMLLFLAIAALEDTGYMARAAFIMDPVMHKMGLHGKSFIPMLIGFGCSVPAIMATRTLDTMRDRIATMFVVPLMSCSARLIVFTVLIAAFFPDKVLFQIGFLHVRLQPAILFSLYLLGIVLAIAGAKLLRATVVRGETTPFVLELPPYRVPTLRGLLIHVWERSRLYIQKAGTVILGITVVLWVLTSYPKKTQFGQDYAARQRAAEEAFVQRVTQLAEPLGMAGHAGPLARAAQAELDLAAAGERFFPREAGYKAARLAHESALRDLRNGPAGDRITRFLEYRERIAGIRDEFAQAAAAHPGDEHSPARFVLTHRRDEALDKLEKADPGAYAAAAAYLDTIWPEDESATQQARHEQESEALAYSVAGRLGRLLEPLIRPLGFDWRIGTALVGAFGAREVFIAQLSVIYAVGSGEESQEALRQRLRADYSPLAGLCMMLFTLVSMQCVPTWVTTRRESGSWRWALFQLGALTALAYVLTLLVYQTGHALGIGV